MANLRAQSVIILDPQNLEVSFTDTLLETISIANVSIASETPGVPVPTILSVAVDSNKLIIETQPLTALAAYYVVFTSTDAVVFKSLNGDNLLLEDGVANRLFFLGSVEDINPVKNYLLSYLRNNVYDLEEPSNINKYISNISIVLSRALADIKQTGNENYITKTVIDEPKVRGNGPFDRLDQEGAYEILRVGKNATSAATSMKLTFDSFPTYPVSLLKKDGSAQLSTNSVDADNVFNTNSLVITLPNRFVSKINSIVFKYDDGRADYNYDISHFGYQIVDNVYDKNQAFVYLGLEDNQIKISEQVLFDESFSLENIFRVDISYEYRDTGRIIDNNTISVNGIMTSGREALPPLRNIFDLKHAPILSSDGTPGSIGSINFIDPNAVTGSKHPAFKNEIFFRLDALPSRAGDYSIDYLSGRVYVFGNDFTNSGTGNFPPLAIYQYQLNYKLDIDYSIDQGGEDLVALPNGSMTNSDVSVSFNFEQNLAKDIDYVPLFHSESLNERVDNRLVSLNTLSVKNVGITDVFRIYNETSGEIYKLARFYNNKVYFTYVNPPKIKDVFFERASFDLISNEKLFVSSAQSLGSTLQIFQVQLNNNRIMAQTEDGIGASFNSSVSFAKGNVFTQELYFNSRQDIATNLSRLTSRGNYQIDYSNGVVYVVVSIDQDNDIGSISYRRGYVQSSNKHIISINNIYYQTSLLSSKGRQIPYAYFDDNFIVPSTLDLVDEQGVDTDYSIDYVAYQGKVGSFNQGDFTSGVKDNIKFIRGIYDINDLLHNANPLNFSNAAFANANIELSPISFQEYHSIQLSGSNKIVQLNLNLPYLSPNIELSVSVKKVSNGQELWNNTGVVSFQNPIVLSLPSGTPGNVNDSVVVNYSFQIKDLAHLVLDYNRGDYYIDYSYLADEILVSYEYGDNCLDFRKSNYLSTGDNYFVSYRVGALRNGLLKNFGSLIDIPVLNSFDILFDRERYRDGITAAMHSLGSGPTVAAIKNIARTISHLPAELSEAAFEGWSLGSSQLYQDTMKTTGEFEFDRNRHIDGVVINKPGQSISLPIVGNLRLEGGTFESWVKPEWNGIDNDAELTIYVSRDGTDLLPTNIYLGASEIHPVLSLDSISNKKFFKVKKTDIISGLPNKKKNGLFIYLSEDASKNFERWSIEIFDGDTASHAYQVKVISSSKFYDVKNSILPKSGSISSAENWILFSLSGIGANQGITFVSDNSHYILDAGKSERSRISIFRDEFGYLVFRVIDEAKRQLTISADISSWDNQELHHVAASWKINTVFGHDEMHLFIDGFEVPNLIRYGSRAGKYYHEKYRTVNLEEIIGKINKSIIGSTDLIAHIGDNKVISSINFSNYNISNADIIYIDEIGFNPMGYTIVNVNGNTLTLSASMPSNLVDGRFSVNRQVLPVRTELDRFSNVAVETIHSIFHGNDLAASGGAVFTSAANNFNNLNILPGYLLSFGNKVSNIIQVSSHTLTTDSDNTSTFTGTSFNVYQNKPIEIPGTKAIHPSYHFVRDGYDAQQIVLDSQILANDLVLIKNFGLNHKKVHQQYFHYGNASNVLKTHLPAPISLNDVKIRKIIRAKGTITSTLTAGISNGTVYPDSQPNTVANGRTLEFNITGSNIDFTSPVSITITGQGYNLNTGLITNLNETITSSKQGYIYSTKQYISIDNFQVSYKKTITSGSDLLLEVKEKYSLMYLENNSVFSNAIANPAPVIRMAYQLYQGNTLSADGYGNLTDTSAAFSDLFVNNFIIIHSPTASANYYPILSISTDRKTITVGHNLLGNYPPAFTNGVYEILDITKERSGLMNGYFVFEYNCLPVIPLLLTSGLYDIEYYTYVNIPFNISTGSIFFGTDLSGQHPLAGSLSEVRLLDSTLSDVRIGQSLPSNQRSITKDFNSVKTTLKDSGTLVQLDLDSLPFKNTADIYHNEDKHIIKNGNVINENFDRSILLSSNPIILDNDGIVNPSAGTFEFWVNPIFDTNNDPNERYYLDISSNVQEEVFSINKTTVSIAGKASSINHIKLKIDSSNFDYAAGASLSADKQTILLKKALPNQNTPIIISYTPNGLNGDRISIFKDATGYLNFRILANYKEYIVRSPTFWKRDSWHRVKATFSANTGNDTMRILMDGYSYNELIIDGTAQVGNYINFGSSPMSIRASIKITDSLNNIFIGCDQEKNNNAYCLLDNLRISNIKRADYAPYGEVIDPNYSSNLLANYPVDSDAATTLLLNYKALGEKITDFALLNNKNNTLSDFTLNVFDGLNILKNNPKSKEILEKLVYAFRPANARPFINYSD